MPISNQLVLPQGITEKDLIEINCIPESVELLEGFSPDDIMVKAGFVEAGIPTTTNAENKPTILKTVAWMAHEGMNDNRQFFVADDLKELAPTLFREPNFGVLDFNHSAAKKLFNQEPKVIGVWYKVEYRYDEKASKYGLMASGMIFSWLFPQHSEQLLADQERLGHMRFSMMALPRPLEVARDANGPYHIIHEPVFLSVSALNVPPADAHAVGVGTESVQTSEDTLRQRLVAAALARPWQREITELTTVGQGEDTMAEETTFVELSEARVVAERKLTELQIKYDTDMQSASVAQDTFKATVSTLEGTINTLTTKLTEAEVARDSANSEHASAVGKIIELETELTGLREFKVAVEAKEAQTVALQLVDLRMKDLPESFIKAFSAKPEDRQTMLKEKWSAMTDEQWVAYKEDELFVAPAEARISYYERSRKEELLPVTEDSTAGAQSIADRVHKLLKVN